MSEECDQRLLHTSTEGDLLCIHRIQEIFRIGVFAKFREDRLKSSLRKQEKRRMVRTNRGASIVVSVHVLCLRW